jgi:hypothetical protein
MSYDNAEPKVLKTLNSSGQVLDDQGNVINDTSDFWTEKYNQAEPKPDKILHSDGTIKDSAGNLIQDTTEYNVQKYNQAEPIPAKYLHADGTIDENPGGGGGGADLEDNKEVTIDVSTYTEPVEVTPTSGKDGMKKATITLSNIPSGSRTLYNYKDSEDYDIGMPLGYCYSFYSPSLITETGSYTVIYGYTAGGDETASTSKSTIDVTVENGVITYDNHTLIRDIREDIVI